MMFSKSMLCVVLIIKTVSYAFAEDVVLPIRRTSLNDCNKRFSTTYQRSSAVNWVLPFDFLHLSAITKMGSLELNCIASLISENVILGATYCAPNKSESYRAIFYKTPLYDKYHIDQQRKIVEITVHPNFETNSNLYNIALMKLEKNVNINVNVVPVCLWSNEDTASEILYVPLIDDENSKILSRTLTKINRANCTANLLCASFYMKEQPKTEADDCAEYENRNNFFAIEDDRHEFVVYQIHTDINIRVIGQPEMRLNQDGKFVPVVLGMLSNVGDVVSYIPIVKYRDWITTAYENLITVFDLNVCIERYKHLREDVFNYPDSVDFLDTEQLRDDIPISLAPHTGCIHTFDVADFYRHEHEEQRSQFFIGSEELPVPEEDKKSKMAFNTFTVKIIWADEMATNLSSCYGAHVEPDAVITLAQCTSYMGTAPTKVMFSNFKQFNIRKIIVHPNYTRTAEPNYNDVAVIKIYSKTLFPTVCGWYGKGVPSRPVGVKAVVTSSFPNSTNSTDNLKFNTTLTTNLENNDQCLSALRKHYQLPQDSLDKYLCLQQKPSSGQRSYQIQLGAPVHNIKRIHNYVIGLNLVGKEVDVDTPMIGVRLSTHIAWFESVLLPPTVKKNQDLSFEAVTYIDRDLQYWDHCRYSDDSKGVCTAVSNCSAIKPRLDTGKPITFCSNHTVVCCPQQIIVPVERDLKLCPKFYWHLREERYERSMVDHSLKDQSPHLVEIGWVNSKQSAFECIGYLITVRDIVTIASCLNLKGSLPNVVRLGGIWPRNGTEATYISISDVAVHRKYIKTSVSQEHNIALVTLASGFEPNWHIFPGCIWLNQTIFPTQQKIFNKAEKRFDEIYQMYHNDCEAYLGVSVPDTEACMFVKQWTCGSYYNVRLKEASPKCLQAKKSWISALEAPLKITESPIIHRQLYSGGRQMERLMSFWYKYIHSSYDIIRSLRISSEKDWIVSILESKQTQED